MITGMISVLQSPPLPGQPPVGSQPSCDGEHEQQPDRDDEIGHSDAQGRDKRHHVVDPGVLVDRRDDAGGQAELNASRIASPPSCMLIGQVAADQLVTRLGRALERDAEVAVQRAAHVVQVLLVQRLDPARTCAGCWLWRPAAAADLSSSNGPPGTECISTKRQDRDDQEDDDQADDAADKVA